MTPGTFLYDAFWWIVGIATGVVSGAVYWVARNIITNKKQIELLEQSVQHAQEMRKVQDKDIKQIRDDQKEILKHLLSKK